MEFNLAIQRGEDQATQYLNQTLQEAGNIEGEITKRRRSKGL